VTERDLEGLVQLCEDPEHAVDSSLDTHMGPKPQRTALHLAVSQGDSDAALTLLANGADVNATDDAGASVFARVAYMADRRMLDIFRVYEPTVDHEPSPLLAAGQHADTGAVNNIAEACQAGDAAVVTLMLYLGGKVDHPLANGDSAMHVAVSRHRADLVQELIRGGADLTVLDGGNRSALQRAATQEESGEAREVLQLLLEKHSDVAELEHVRGAAVGGGHRALAEMVRSARLARDTRFYDAIAFHEEYGGKSVSQKIVHWIGTSELLGHAE
jgi:hypothetical protein